MHAYLHNLWKLYVIRTLFWMHFFSAVLVPFYTDWGGISLSDVLVLNAWFFLCSFLLEVPTGTVADVFGRKWSLVAGSAAAIAGVLVYTSRPSFAVFMVAEVVMAVAYTLHSGADEALAYDSLQAGGESHRAAEVVGRMEAFKLGGIIAGTLSGGFVAAALGLRATMLAYVLPAALATLLALSLREPPGAHVRSERPAYLTLLREGSRYFAGHRTLRRLAIEAALTHGLAWGIIWLFQPLLRRAGVPLAQFGVVHALGVAGQILFLSQVSRLERWAGGKRRLLLGASLLAGAAFLGLALTRAWPLVVLGILVGMGLSLPRVPLYTAAINHHTGSGARATVLSLASMMRQFAIVVMNPIIGYLAEWSLSAALGVMGVGLGVLAVLTRVSEAELEGPASR